MKRNRYEWKAQVISEDGQSAEQTVRAFWDPDHELTEESVGHAGAMQEWIRRGKPQVEGRPVRHGATSVKFVGQVGVKEIAS